MHQQLFQTDWCCKKGLDEGTLLIVDELDSHLHPLLTKHLVSLFNSVEFNPNGDQFIFTSHNTNLFLSAKIPKLRRGI